MCQNLPPGIGVCPPQGSRPPPVTCVAKRLHVFTSFPMQATYKCSRGWVHTAWTRLHCNPVQANGCYEDEAIQHLVGDLSTDLLFLTALWRRVPVNGHGVVRVRGSSTNFSFSHHANLIARFNTTSGGARLTTPTGGAKFTPQLVGPDSPQHLVGPDSPHQLVGPDSPHQLVGSDSPH